MAFDGLGTFVRTNGTNSGSTTWAQDAAAAVKITTARHDSHDQDLANGLTNCVTKDGQTTPTANLPMGGFGHTNTAVATARTMYARASQVADGALRYGGLTTGAANVFVATLSPAITAYVTGMEIVVLTHQANTGACTLNVNSVGAVSLKVLGADPTSGTIGSGQILTAVHDGTYFQIQNVSNLVTSIATDRLLGRDTAGTGVVEQIGLNATLSFDGSGNVQRAALTGDVTAAAGSNATTIGADKVTSTKFRLANGTFLRIDNLAGTAQSILTVDASDNVLLNSPGAVNIGKNNAFHWTKDGTGHLTPLTDNTYDLGAPALRPRAVYGHELNLKPAVVAGAGTVQGDATVLTARVNIVTSGGAATGVKLPTAVEGMMVWVSRTAGSCRYIYPDTGAAINALAANAAYDMLAGNLGVQLIATSATQWYTLTN